MADPQFSMRIHDSVQKYEFGGRTISGSDGLGGIEQHRGGDFLGSCYRHETIENTSDLDENLLGDRERNALNQISRGRGGRSGG